MKKWILALSLCLVSFTSSIQAATIIYSLDFDEATSTLTAGYTRIPALHLVDSSLNVTGITGSGGAATINFAASHMGGYDAGDPAQPLISNGIYTFGNGSFTHDFTISGLNPGDLVTIYALAAWDGNGRGGSITFGTETTWAQTIGNPGTSPTLANFTQINTTAVAANGSGIVTGLFLGPNGNVAQEGQFGGMIIQVVQAVPEPSTYALVGLGLVGLFLVRRRSAAKA